MTDGLLSVDEALARVLAATPNPGEPEIIWLREALGRVLAEPVESAIDLPPWDNSAMDGYAIRSADVLEATDSAPVRLDVIGEVRAGQPPETTVRRATAVRIATGAPLPAGADAVVPVELTTPVDANGTAGARGRDATGPVPTAILVHERVAQGGSIRRMAGDLRAGSRILETGSVLTPAAIALAAGAGLDRFSVHRRPIVGILATGDEVRSPGSALGPAGIPDANGPAIAAMVEEAGGDPRNLGIAADRFDDVRARLCAGLVEGADAIIVSGGVSVGPYDVVRAAFESFGSIDLWRVAVQPGKPFAFGTGRLSGDANAGGTDAGGGADAGGETSRPPALLFGLPGNPVSTFVTFELFVRPAIRRLAGRRDDDLFRARDRAVIGEAVSKGHGRRAFIRVTVERDDRGTPVRDDHGRVRTHLAGGQAGQGSHVLSALAIADALAVVPEADDAVPPGTELELWWLDRA